MLGLESWVETADFKAELKDAKSKVQRALMPGQVQGGSAEVNFGVSYEFPDAKVYNYNLKNNN